MHPLVQSLQTALSQKLPRSLVVMRDYDDTDRSRETPPPPPKEVNPLYLDPRNTHVIPDSVMDPYVPDRFARVGFLEMDREAGVRNIFASQRVLYLFYAKAHRAEIARLRTSATQASSSGEDQGSDSAQKIAWLEEAIVFFEKRYGEYMEAYPKIFGQRVYEEILANTAPVLSALENPKADGKVLAFAREKAYLAADQQHVNFSINFKPGDDKLLLAMAVQDAFPEVMPSDIYLLDDSIEKYRAVFRESGFGFLEAKRILFDLAADMGCRIDEKVMYSAAVLCVKIERGQFPEPARSTLMAHPQLLKRLHSEFYSQILSEDISTQDKIIAEVRQEVSPALYHNLRCLQQRGLAEKLLAGADGALATALGQKLQEFTYTERDAADLICALMDKGVAQLSLDEIKTFWEKIDAVSGATESTKAALKYSPVVVQRLRALCAEIREAQTVAQETLVDFSAVQPQSLREQLSLIDFFERACPYALEINQLSAGLASIEKSLASATTAANATKIQSLGAEKAQKEDELDKAKRKILDLFSRVSQFSSAAWEAHFRYFLTESNRSKETRAFLLLLQEGRLQLDDRLLGEKLADIAHREGHVDTFARSEDAFVRLLQYRVQPQELRAYQDDLVSDLLKVFQRNQSVLEAGYQEQKCVAPLETLSQILFELMQVMFSRKLPESLLRAYRAFAGELVDPSRLLSLLNVRIWGVLQSEVALRLASSLPASSSSSSQVSGAIVLAGGLLNSLALVCNLVAKGSDTSLAPAAHLLSTKRAEVAGLINALMLQLRGREGDAYAAFNFEEKVGPVFSDQESPGQQAVVRYQELVQTIVQMGDTARFLTAQISDLQRRAGSVSVTSEERAQLQKQIGDLRDQVTRAEEAATRSNQALLAGFRGRLWRDISIYWLTEGLGGGTIMFLALAFSNAGHTVFPMVWTAAHLAGLPISLRATRDPGQHQNCWRRYLDGWAALPRKVFCFWRGSPQAPSDGEVARGLLADDALTSGGTTRGGAAAVPLSPV